MITGAYDQLQEIAQGNVCADDGGELVVAWFSQAKTYVIRCGEDHYPDRVTRQLSLTQAYKADLALPLPVQENIEKRQRRQVMNNDEKPVDPRMALLPRTDLATGELLSPDTVKALVRYAMMYGLDAYRGHVVLMYGKPYVTLDGYLYHSRRLGEAYTMGSKPLDHDERVLYMVPEEAHAWLCIIDIDGGKKRVTGIGVVTKEEMTEESKKKPGQLRSPVVAAHPWQLAQKRAEWQALRRAFPIGESKEEESETRD